MKKILLTCLIILWQFNSQAQNIQNISFIPAFPGPLDSVKVIVDLVFNSGSCELQYENHSMSNDSIRINVFHCPGALTVICNTTDTINLGLLAPGTYSTEVIVHTSSWSAPDPCSDVNPTDSGDVQITVLPGSGINENSLLESFIYFDAGTNDIVLSGKHAGNVQLILLNSLGQVCLKKEFGNTERISIPELSKGVYLYQLISDTEKIISGKIQLSH